MIVVVIIGILAAVAIPSYQGFQDKARASEAKIALSAIYVGEKSYFAEEGGYSTVLKDIGLGAGGKNLGTLKYFGIGFQGTANITWHAGVVGITTETNKCNAGLTRFRACAQKAAGGYKPATDWRIDENRSLQQTLQ